MSTPTVFKKFTKVDRNSLFYGQFKYQCKYHVPEASCLRKLDHDAINKVISHRNEWTSGRRIGPTQAKSLHDICDQLTALTNPFKTMISGNWIYFYTNELLDIDVLAQGDLGKPLWGEISEVNITHSKGEIGLRNPQFNFRTFIREHRPSPQEITTLKSFVESAGSDLRASPGMLEFLKHSSRRVWLSDGYFFDHNEMSMATALALISPKLIRKTLPIVQVNN